MIVGVPRESFPGERRVALVPAVIPNLTKVGLEVVVEAGAGAAAGYPDADYPVCRPFSFRVLTGFGARPERSRVTR